MLRHVSGNVKGGEQGQALVEFAMSLVLLLLILMGVIDLGRVYFTLLALQDAVGEGAAYGLIHPTWHGESDSPNPNNITYRTQNESPSGLLDWSETTVTVDAPYPTPGNQITVTIAFDYEFITPIMQAVLGGTITVQATAIQVIMSSDAIPPES